VETNRTSAEGVPDSDAGRNGSVRGDDAASVEESSDTASESRGSRSGKSRRSRSKSGRSSSGRRHRRRSSSEKSDGKNKKLADQLGLVALILAILSVLVSIPLQQAIPGLVLGLLAFLIGTFHVGLQLIRHRRDSLGRWALGLSLLAVAAGLLSIRRERAAEQELLTQRAEERFKEEEEELEKLRRGNPASSVKPPQSNQPNTKSGSPVAGGPEGSEPRPAASDEDPLLDRFGVPTVSKPDDPSAVAMLRQRGLAVKEQNVTFEGSTEDQTVVTEVVFLSPRATDELLRTLGPALSKLPNLRILNLFGGQVTEAGLAAVLSGEVLSEITLPQASDSIASQLSRFRNLRKVVFDRRGSISDDGLAQLAQLTRLRRLDLGGTRDGSVNITDAGARSLAQLRALRDLILSQTALTAEGVRLLGSITPLEQLDLSLTEVTDDSLQPFGDLKNLRSLKLRGTQVQGPALQHLAKCQSLESLQLSELSRFDSDALRHLVGHPRLKSLNLSGTRLDKRAVEHLQRIPSLELLEMNDSGVAEADVRELRAALPKCTVEAVKLFTD
jgi:hypothetical protein